ncbi:MAG: metallophosphoesterase [Candidatus Hydrogenedentes bacterium]|nr:metallophosphoesterase [Candidatus Hydrogenedentota bacterium]
MPPTPSNTGATPQGSGPRIDHVALRDRVGAFHYRMRINLQTYHARGVIGVGRTRFHPENLWQIKFALTLLLKLTGLYGIGRRNTKRFEVVENEVQLRRLPDAFQGYRVLHLSDLHLDIDPGITDALIEALRGLEYDVCVITGDFRGETWGDIGPALHETTRLLPHITAPVYAILGNHDFMEIVPPLEAQGVQFLLNETAALEKDGATIYLSGVDDPHFYELQNFEKICEGVPINATKILLSHSAEPYRAALACGFDIMLSGHTHGGQICLPGRIPLICNADHPRYMMQGHWRFHELLGYTSRGTGVCLVPVRFFCPPEITLHRLHRRSGSRVG